MSATAYPGDGATPEQLRQLAEAFREAAHRLREGGRKRDPASHAPFRLVALQSIELYLNALLLLEGRSPAWIRSMQHDLGARADHIAAAGLMLRQKTATHLHMLRDRREYLVTRYAPELATQASQLNRLNATLDEVARKVSAIFDRRATPTGAAPTAQAA